MFEIILVAAVIGAMCVLGTILNSVPFTVCVFATWGYGIYLMGWKVFLAGYVLAGVSGLCANFFTTYIDDKRNNKLNV